jgi:hypothetical protein
MSLASHHPFLFDPVRLFSLLFFLELLLGQGFATRCDARFRFICQQVEIWGAIGARQAEVGQKEAELASLCASSTEQLAATEHERAAIAARLSEA